ncbi:MAG: adenylosuccinate lyase [Chloroflexota bacterium]
MDFDHNTFISPFTWRYGSETMRQIWSEHNKRLLMRQVWVALATAQHQAGLITAEQVADLQQHRDQVDIERALVIEQETRHDVMAEIRTFAEQCPVGGGIIHLGATSADITDNVDVLRLREAAVLLRRQLAELLQALADRIEATADLPTMAHTHIQPAEPTTLGYRFAVYAQDLLEDYKALDHLIATLRGKGLKGAVGTQAAYDELLHDSPMSAAEMEAVAMQVLDLPTFPIATQTYTRQQDLRVQQVLAGMAASLHKFALDFRILQSPPFGEWAEPFGQKQVGSSAMPFKRNPINTENICSLARYVGALPAVAWDNASQAILERSLDDSANRRVFQAESFLAMDELLRRAVRLVREMVVDETAVARNMAIYGPFAATERLLMALVKAGASRQDAHEWIRACSLEAWAVLRQGQSNPLLDLLVAHGEIGRFLNEGEIRPLLDATAHTGTAAVRARQLAQAVGQVVTA